MSLSHVISGGRKPSKHKQSQFRRRALQPPRSSPLPRCHGNGVHGIKVFNRSIRILPRSGTSLLILPGLGQALLGNLRAFSHRGGKVGKTHSHVSQRAASGQPHRNLRWMAFFLTGNPGITAENPLNAAALAPVKWLKEMVMPPQEHANASICTCSRNLT